MAITLDELLGRNTTETRTESFPSYEEFSSARNVNNGYAPARNENYAPTEDFGYSPRNYSASVQTRPSFEEEVYTENFYQPARQQNFYEYVARNNGRLDDAELYERLSRTHDNMRPVFDRSESATMERKGLFTQQNVASQQKVRGRLNTKGKLILGSFLAVVVTVMSLIIAFAGKINNGTAVVPASNAVASVAAVSQTL